MVLIESFYRYVNLKITYLGLFVNNEIVINWVPTLCFHIMFTLRVTTYFTIISVSHFIQYKSFFTLKCLLFLILIVTIVLYLIFYIRLNHPILFNKLNQNIEDQGNSNLVFYWESLKSNFFTIKKSERLNNLSGSKRPFPNVQKRKFSTS